MNRKKDTTRGEAIAYFKRHLDLYCVEGISRESEEMAIKALERTRWIPISERNPKKDGEYLVTVRGLMGRYVEVEIML